MRRTAPFLACLALAAGIHANGAVTVETNIVFATGAINAHTVPGTKDLLLDVYRPADSNDISGNALVLVHGGGFTTGDRTSGDMVDAGLYFADRGWVCFSIEYRLMGDDPPAPIWIEMLSNAYFNAVHAAMVDTKRAIRWVREHAAQYGCSTNRVAGLGHSAGAYCVIQMCISDDDDFANDAGTATPDQWPGHSGKLNAGVEVSGGLIMGSSEFDSKDTPYMIWHGDADGTVPYSEALTNHAECTAHRIPHRFFTLAGIDHGAPTWTALYEGRGIKEHAEDFLGLFFDLQVSSISATSGTVRLEWPSLTNAIYDIRATADLTLPFTNVIPALTSASDTCTSVVPMPSGVRFYRIGIHSGQPGY